MGRFVIKSRSVCGRQVRCMGTNSADEDVKNAKLAEEEFERLYYKGHFEELKKKHSVHDPYDQVYSTAVFTPPVHRDFLMEDMQSYMEKVAPLQVGATKYGAYV